MGRRRLLLAKQLSSASSEPYSPRRERILLAVHGAKLGGAERMALLEAESLKARFELLVAVPDGPLRSRFAAHGGL